MAAGKINMIISNATLFWQGDLLKGSLVIHEGKIVELLQSEKLTGAFAAKANSSVDMGSCAADHQAAFEGRKDAKTLPDAQNHGPEVTKEAASRLKSYFAQKFGADFTVIDGTGLHVFPGFIDTHVHLREPGFEHKETIKTGTAAAAHGGFTSVCAMPNLKPVPDTLQNLKAELSRIKESASVHVFPYGAITCGEKGGQLSDMAALSPFVAGFSDDGVGVQNADMMRAAMQEAKRLGKPIVAHAEEIGLVQGGVVHDGVYARMHHHRGNPAASEWRQVQRDIALVKQTGASYHVCHISTKETVEIVREARAQGLDVTCETAPHYLALNDEMLQEDGRFRMNPPIRSRLDQMALLQGLKDGTILCIGTDHAPHTSLEKSGGLDNSLNGVVGLETAFPVLYTELVRTGFLPLTKLLSLLTQNPYERFCLGDVRESFDGAALTCGLKLGCMADLTIFDLHTAYKISSDEFLSLGKASPFIDKQVYGVCLLTVAGGKVAYAGGYDL